MKRSLITLAAALCAVMIPAAVSAYGVENNAGLRTAEKISPTKLKLVIGPGMTNYQFEQQAKKFQVVSEEDKAFSHGVSAVSAAIVKTEDDVKYPAGWKGPRFSKYTIEVDLPSNMKLKDGRKYWIRILAAFMLAKNRSAQYIYEKGHTFTPEESGPRYGIRETFVLAPDTIHIMTGPGIDLANLADTANIKIFSKDDAAYSGGLSPVKIDRRSNLDFYVPSGWPWNFSQRHELFVKLPKPMTQGKTYTVELNAVSGKPVTCGVSKTTVRFDDGKNIDLAIKVNQYGYLPDAEKYAYLGLWLGDGGAYDFTPYAKTFEVRDAKTGETVFSGVPGLRHKPGEKTETVYRQDLSYEYTWELGFSKLEKPGKYYIAIPGVGRSFEFSIDENVYAKPMKIAMNGVFHQRCGIEIKAPCASPGVYRPACHRNMTEYGTMSSDNFHTPKLVNFATDGKKHDIYGGHHDAGDWNPRARFEYAEWLMLLYELNPKAFYDKQFPIPEAGNGIPDLVDEAWWSFDVWNRLQDADGGVHSKIETNGDPVDGDAPENDSLREFAFRKELAATYHYAAMSARFALIWKSLGRNDLAEKQTASALKAWEWAEKNADDPVLSTFNKGLHARIIDQRAAASAILFKLTGEKRFDDAFHAASVFVTMSRPQLLDYGKYDQLYASYYYASIPEGIGDEVLKNKIISTFESTFDYWQKFAETTNYRYMRSPYSPNNWGTGALPMWVNMPAMAWHLTKSEGKKQDIRQWILFTNDFSLGCDPMNLCFAVGQGQRYVTTSWSILQASSPGHLIPGFNSNGPCAGYGVPGMRPKKGGMVAWPAMALYPAGKDSWPQLYLYSEDASPGQNEGCHPYTSAFAYGLFLPPAKK